MRDLVLVHGAWHGAWCWRRVLPLLADAGARAVTVSLTGVGEKAHLLGPAVTVATHVADVVAAVRAEECRDAVLVGHSYGGVPVTAAADVLGDAVGPLVYVDAVVPAPGECWSSLSPPETAAARRATIAATGALPPPPASAFGLTGGDAAWVDRRQTPQPGGVYDDPVDFSLPRWLARSRTFLDCTTPPLPTIDPSRARVRSQPGWDVVELATGRDPMVSAPGLLAAELLRVAAG
nr:alpha/beta fold hydrolase [Modestobacter sp. Leaf380]